jgi:hypothetical protein
VKKARTVRQRTIERLRSRLLRHGSPRLQMSLIVGAAASMGFLSSVGLLWLGFHAMWLRYAVAACIGYGFFLGLVWLWLPARRRKLAQGPDLSDIGDVLDFGDSVVDVISSGPGRAASSLPAEATTAGGDVGALDLDLGLDELIVVVAVVAAIVAGLVAAGYVVFSAPSFFAEVLADGAISYGLYRRFRGLERDHWINSAVSRTWLPFAIVVLFLALAGAAMQWYAPGADSIGDVWTAMNASASGGRRTRG